MMMDPSVSYFYSGILQYTCMISALITTLYICSKQTKNMYAYTIYTGMRFYVRVLHIKDNYSRSIGFILQHGIKKNRNSFFASKDDPQANRRLRQGSEFSFWSHWVAAYRQNQDTNSLPIHRKLTDEHLDVDDNLKMRNHLAFEVMNDDMLHLMMVGTLRSQHHITGKERGVINNS